MKYATWSLLACTFYEDKTKLQAVAPAMAPGRAVTAKVNRPLPEMRPALAYMYADQVKNHRPCQFWGDNYPLMHGTAKWRDAPQVKKKERECEVFLRRRSRRRSALIPSFGK